MRGKEAGGLATRLAILRGYACMYSCISFLGVMAYPNILSYGPHVIFPSVLACFSSLELGAANAVYASSSSRFTSLHFNPNPSLSPTAPHNRSSSSLGFR
jgi:hypothetical protein